MSLQSKEFKQLTTAELFLIMRERVDVFVVEQACAYPELDDVDCHQQTVHLFTRDDNALTSYARCYIKNEQYSAIGRVLVSKATRRKGKGVELVNAAIACCFKHFSGRDIHISAQTYLLDFYRSFGFTLSGDVYLEDGIPHQDMILKNPSIS